VGFPLFGGSPATLVLLVLGTIESIICSLVGATNNEQITPKLARTAHWKH
jgi:hypothetical protein